MANGWRLRRGWVTNRKRQFILRWQTLPARRVYRYLSSGPVLNVRAQSRWAVPCRDARGRGTCRRQRRRARIRAWAAAAAAGDVHWEQGHQQAHVKVRTVQAACGRRALRPSTDHDSTLRGMSVSRVLGDVANKARRVCSCTYRSRRRRWRRRAREKDRRESMSERAERLYMIWRAPRARRPTPKRCRRRGGGLHAGRGPPGRCAPLSAMRVLRAGGHSSTHRASRPPPSPRQPVPVCQCRLSRTPVAS